jgi:hypothetical protein
MTMPTEPQAPGAPEAGAPNGGQQPAAAAPETQQPSEQAQDVSQLPDWAQKALKDARADAAKHRTTSKATAEQVSAEQAKLNKVLGALGLNAEGEEVPDPEALASQLEEGRTELWSAKAELQIMRAAPKHGVNADALTDSVKFWESLGELDAGDPEFATKVDAAIIAAVKANPGLKATSTAARSGGEMTGAPPPAKQRPKSLTEALTKALGGGAD